MKSKRAKSTGKTGKKRSRKKAAKVTPKAAIAKMLKDHPRKEKKSRATP